MESRCYRELTSDASCPEGWEEDAYGFYAIPPPLIAAAHGGAACPPAAPACPAGEGDCPPDIDCVGTWSECDANCKQVWTESVARSGTLQTVPSLTVSFRKG